MHQSFLTVLGDERLPVSIKNWRAHSSFHRGLHIHDINVLRPSYLWHCEWKYFDLILGRVGTWLFVHACPQMCYCSRHYSRLHPLAVAGHVHLQAVGVVQHLRSKQIVLQVTPHLSKLQQLPLVKDSPAGNQVWRVWNAYTALLKYKKNNMK